MDGSKEMNLNNYKGIYFEEDTEKYFCPKTGAHFKFEEICNLLERIRTARAELESKTIPKRELAKTYYAPAIMNG